MSKTAREVIAAAGRRGDRFRHYVGWPTADEILAALDAAGFVIVPKEPTEKMLSAPNAAEVIVGPNPGYPIDPDEAKDIYRAMIAASV